MLASIFSYDWKMEKKVNFAFLNVLCHLISANSIYLIPTLKMIVKNLTSLPSSANNNNVELKNILHEALRLSISMVPTGLNEIPPILQSNFPYKRQPVENIVGYAEELLFICEYLPVLQQKVIDLIIEKCLEIDVEIVIEDSGLINIESKDCMDKQSIDKVSDNMLGYIYIYIYTMIVYSIIALNSHNSKFLNFTLFEFNDFTFISYRELYFSI